jgi:hypothetical protein
MKSILHAVTQEHEGNRPDVVGKKLQSRWTDDDDDDELIDSPVSSQIQFSNSEAGTIFSKRGDDAIGSILQAVTQEDPTNKLDLTPSNGKEIWSDDDDDCVIIENPNETNSMSLHCQSMSGHKAASQRRRIGMAEDSVLKRYQSQNLISQSPTFQSSKGKAEYSIFKINESQSSKTFGRGQRPTKKKSPLLASFTRVQKLGIRSKFDNASSTPINQSSKCISSSIVTVSSKKKRVVTTPKNLQSIKGFFKPLPTKHEKL